MSAMQAFTYGFVGALLINVVRLAELANVPKIQRPPTFTDPFFVLQFLGLPLVGGALCWIYQADGTALKPLLAANIGVSAPLILKSFAAAIPPKPPQNTD